MLSYIFRRLIFDMIPTLVIVAIVSFALIHLTPGDPAVLMLGDTATPAQIAALHAQLGLNDPLPLQFWFWVVRVMHGDLGQSIFLHESVVQGIADHLPVTLELTLFSTLITVLLGISSGIISAIFRGTILDKAMMALALLGLSIPEFYLGLLMALVIGVKLQWLPVAGYTSFMDDPVANLQSMIMPALALGLGQAAFVSRITRSSMLEVKGLDFIRTARAKGTPGGRVILVHMLRNAMVPIVSTTAVVISILMGGATISETIFGIPGMGQLIISAVQNRDYPLLQGAVLVVVVVYVFINLAVDVVYALVDPRVRYS
ncbi:MAG TPA: ABC transporter permease [Ktedonobacteraceae bacterium]|jgi:peptide/nickel transport system permease protein|nr:ABC transporter permease [Ktedonobacteraceae bacterium]